MCTSGVKVLDRESLVPRKSEQIATGEKDLWQVPLLSVSRKKWNISKATIHRDRGLCVR